MLYKRLLLLGLLLLTLCGCSAMANERPLGFTADMDATISGITSRAKVMATDNSYRMDIIGGRRASTVITRYDKKLVWLLVPEEKKYVQLTLADLKDDIPEFFRPGIKMEKKTIGNDTINKVKAVKYKITTVSSKNKKFTGYLWEAKNLPGFPLKWEDSESGLVVVWKNGKLDSIPASMFEVPKGYTELATGQK